MPTPNPDCRPYAPAIVTDDPTDLQTLIAKYGVFLRYSVAAEIATVSVRTLKRATDAGALPCYRVGTSGSLRVKTADICKLIVRVA